MNTSQTPVIDDKVGVIVTDHLLVRDKETQKVLVNQRGTAKNPDQGEKDE